MPLAGALLAEGSLLEGRYRVDRVVGRGGFGVVHAGWHLVLDCPVAIKAMALADEAGGERAGRFLDEARTLSRLRHPAIVRVLDAGVSDPGAGAPLTAWLVMEWCGERTLARDLEERGGAGRTPSEAWALLRPIVDAVAAAHAAGVIHRDIKPSNIMLVDGLAGHGAEPGSAGRSPERGPGPEARLIDFGIAKRWSAPRAPSTTLSTDGPRAHTPAYAAPEQLAGTRTGPWTDVHAIALVLTEVIAGERAYGKLAQVGAILDPVRPTPATLGVDAGTWEPVLGRALALDATARYPDAGALRDALDAALPEATAPDAPSTIRDPITPRSSPSPAARAGTTSVDAPPSSATTLPDARAPLPPASIDLAPPAASTRTATPIAPTAGATPIVPTAGATPIAPTAGATPPGVIDLHPPRGSGILTTVLLWVGGVCLVMVGFFVLTLLLYAAIEPAHTTPAASATTRR